MLQVHFRLSCELVERSKSLGIIPKRSYRRRPKHSEHYEIALWFRELASVGEWERFRHDDPAKLLKSRSRLSARPFDKRSLQLSGALDYRQPRQDLLEWQPYG